MSTATMASRPPFRDRLAAGLRGFGPLGIFAFLLVAAGVAVVVPLAALIVVLWAWLSKTPWREIGYVWPENWGRTLLVGITFGIAFKLLMKIIVMPLLGADPVNQAYHYMVYNTTALAVFVLYAVVGAGWGEETVFRGFLFERIGKLFGTGPFGKGIAIIATTTIFGSLHYMQGWAGIEQALIVGAVFATVFAFTGRLVVLMVAHAAFDLLAALIVFLDLETQVGHLVFK